MRLHPLYRQEVVHRTRLSQGEIDVVSGFSALQQTESLTRGIIFSTPLDLRNNHPTRRISNCLPE